MKRLFFGEYTHTLDVKNRLFIPAQFRDELGARFVICKSPPGNTCVFAYSEERFKELGQKIKEKAGLRQQRFAFEGITTVEIDKSGRITINQKLCDYATLKKNVVVFGAFDRIEIWEEEKFRLEQQLASQESVGENQVIIPY
ncbi:MAG TPA: cell division/cell wall cluster transcriptional repressor MraZ [Clostridiales bacterium]|nr:cell division/cell wall cluster transcriptional repressor MraZ [Clostridiales bacterium]